MNDDAKFMYLMVNTEAEFLLKCHMGMKLFVKKIQTLLIDRQKFSF